MSNRRLGLAFTCPRISILLCLLALFLPSSVFAQGKVRGDFQKPLLWSGCGVGPLAVLLADVNGDGNLDAIAVDTTVNICLGDGHGGFNFFSYYPTATPPPAVDYTSALAIGSFARKGVVDIAVGSANNIRILLGNGDGTFRISMDYAVVGHPTQMAVADLNGDGYLDLVSVNADAGTVSVLLGNGDGTFQPASKIGTSPGPISIALGDFNADGKIDLAIAFCRLGQNSTVPFRQDSCAESPDAPQVLFGNGDGTFQSGTSISNSIVGATNSIATADLNGDGKLDLVTVTSQPYPSLGTVYSSILHVLLGNGDGSFRPVAGYAINYPQLPGNNIGFGDFNGDGKMDIVIAGEGINTDVSFGGTIAELGGNGDGSFQPAVFYCKSEVSEAIAVGDVNNDGLPDIITSDFTQGNGNSGSVMLNAGTFLRSVSSIVVSATPTSDPNDPFQPVILTATLTVPPGTLNGQRFGGDPVVTFQIDNQTVSPNGFTNVALPASLNASGVANITIPFLSSGQHSIFVSYSGNSTTLASISSPITVMIPPKVNGTDLVFLLKGSSSATVPAGGSATFNLSVSSIRPLPPPGSVTLSCSSASGLTCAFNPPSLVQPGRPIYPMDVTQTVASAKASARTRSFPTTIGAALVILPLFGGFFLGAFEKKRPSAFLLFLILFFGLNFGCGGGGPTTARPTPPTNSAVSLTVTASAGTPSLTAVQNLTVIVTQ